MKRWKVGLDVDDIIFSCNEYAVELTNNELHMIPPIQMDEITAWGPLGTRADLRLKYFNSKKFFETQPVLPGAVEFVHDLQEYGCSTLSCDESFSILREKVLCLSDHLYSGRPYRLSNQNDRNLLYGRGANDAPVDNRDEPREHASDYPVIHPDDKTRFRQNLSQTLSPVLLLLSNEALHLQP